MDRLHADATAWAPLDGGRPPRRKSRQECRQRRLPPRPSVPPEPARLQRLGGDSLIVACILRGTEPSESFRPCTMSVEACPLIEIRTSAVHGLGGFAIRDISSGTCVGIYAGRRFSEAQLLDEDWTDWDSGQTYLFALSDGTTIDGAQGGNATRYLNHACNPNCLAVEEVDPTGKIIVRVVTTEAVPMGAELLLDYGLIIDASEKASDYPCQCGTPSCRGSMAALHTLGQDKNPTKSRRS